MLNTITQSDSTVVVKTIGQVLKENPITIDAAWEFLNTVLTTYVPRVIFALILLWIGLFLIKFIKKSIKRVMTHRECDPMLAGFIISTVNIVLKVLLAITVINEIGVPMTSFVAILASTSLAVGLALQGTLQNFAGGFIILLFKPFKVADDVEFGGERGIVKQIQIFHTIIESGKDNKILIVPNSQIASATLVNYSTERARRIDQVYNIAYGESVDQARAIILELVKADGRFFPNPYTEGSELEIVVSALSDSSVDIMARVWVKPPDYFDSVFKLNEAVYKRFNEAGIEIPFPQLQIHQK